jgi:16S rRNA (cytosine967-C5)-methyltransferase
MAVRGAVTEARGAAADVLTDLRSGELLDGSFERRTARLDPRDRRWTRELVFGMLRRRSWLDALLDDRVRGGLAKLDPDLIDLLRLGAYQLLAMGSVPPYAAIGQTVELAKRRHGIGASKLANAVLRRLDRERDALVVATPEDPVEALALEYSHPRWLVARWIARWGANETRQLLEANNREAPLVARPYHVVREQLEAMLESAGVTVGDAPLVPDSLVLTAGVVYAGDASFTRLARVRENVRRLDATNVIPFVGDARFPAVKGMDAVLIDVPCTGTGTFRRHPDSRWRLRISDLAVLPAVQRSILRVAATAVRPGGLLVYSTCSLETEENDAQVESFLSDNPEWRLEPPPDGVVPAAVIDAGRLRVLPQRHGTDGAFAARLRRAEAATA